MRGVVDWLTLMGTTEHWVVSCYLKLEPRDRSRGKYLIKLKNRIRRQLGRLEAGGMPRHELEVVEADLRRVREYLEDPGNLPVGRGIAIFACSGVDLFEAVPLPRVLRSRLAVDRSPLVRELAALDDEFGYMVCTVYDRTSARFFQLTAFGIDEVEGLAAGGVTRAGRFHGPRSQWASAGTAAAFGEHNYHQRIREEKQRHYAAVAERLFEFTRGSPLRGIVLGGTGADAGAVQPYLHPYLAERLIGVARLNPKTATPAEVMEVALELRRAAEREREVEQARVLAEGAGTGWSVNGVEASLLALSRGQVRTLLVDPAAEVEGYRCLSTRRLTTRPESCSGEERVAVPDVIDEAIEDTLRQGGHVNVVEHGEVRAAVDGLAALLRFPAR
ncbi:MAG: hypothetical protein ACE5PT_04130 [Gemmatimonadales bacterium]